MQPEEAHIGTPVRASNNLPLGNYYLDESDPDILTLHRQDGSFVAAFSARGATKEGIREAAEQESLAESGWVRHSTRRKSTPTASRRSS